MVCYLRVRGNKKPFEGGLCELMTIYLASNNVIAISKVPTPPWTRIQYTINFVGKKTMSIFTSKNLFFEPFRNTLNSNHFILIKKRVSNGYEFKFQKPCSSNFFRINYFFKVKKYSNLVWVFLWLVRSKIYFFLKYSFFWWKKSKLLS